MAAVQAAEIMAAGGTGSGDNGGTGGEQAAVEIMVAAVQAAEIMVAAVQAAEIHGGGGTGGGDNGSGGTGGGDNGAAIQAADDDRQRR